MRVNRKAPRDKDRTHTLACALQYGTHQCRHETGTFRVVLSALQVKKKNDTFLKKMKKTPNGRVYLFQRNIHEAIKTGELS